MNAETVVKVISDYGFGVGIFFAFIFVLKWILRLTNDIITNNQKQTEFWRQTVDNISDAIRQNTEALKNNIDNNIIAHRHQQEEHKNIIESNTSIVKSLIELNKNIEYLNYKSKEKGGK